MKNYRLQLNCSSTASRYEIESLLQNFLLENDLITSESDDLHLIMVYEIIVLTCEDDENNTNW